MNEIVYIVNIENDYGEPQLLLSFTKSTDTVTKVNTLKEYKFIADRVSDVELYEFFVTGTLDLGDDIMLYIETIKNI